MMFCRKICRSGKLLPVLPLFALPAAGCTPHAPLPEADLTVEIGNAGGVLRAVFD